jgi:hypothetical protein
MEKRSHRRIRDLVALTAFQGLVANEIGCARISMMAGEQKRSLQGPNTEARDQLSPDQSYPACIARPVHTEVPEAVIEGRQNSFKSLAISTGPVKCFFTSSAQAE